MLRRAVHRARPAVTWSIDRGPVFDNCIGELTFQGRRAGLTVYQARPLDDNGRPAFEPVFDIDLVAGSFATVREPAASGD